MKEHTFKNLIIPKEKTKTRGSLQNSQPHHLPDCSMSTTPFTNAYSNILGIICPPRTLLLPIEKQYLFLSHWEWVELCDGLNEWNVLHDFWGQVIEDSMASALSLSRCLPLESCHHAVRKPKFKPTGRGPLKKNWGFSQKLASTIRPVSDGLQLLDLEPFSWGLWCQKCCSCSALSKLLKHKIHEHNKGLC